MYVASFKFTEGKKAYLKNFEPNG